ncbi:hypothetical protein CVIRNUC_006142 [Coccomyxa viridis]|uniref:Uncharacterized protein n=1 Tax=Coccomyxa viridis TaxID=1274662 RepID=A0AAV1I8A3_9CHLO|nr:hypothetical protein CVIRNUC_006142 [Coccomyxa viridis]
MWKAAHSSGAASAYTHWHGAVDGGPQRRLSEALGATPVAPVVIPAPRVVEPAPRAATVAQPARQTSSVPAGNNARPAAAAAEPRTNSNAGPTSGSRGVASQSSTAQNTKSGSTNAAARTPSTEGNNRPPAPPASKPSAASNQATSSATRAVVAPPAPTKAASASTSGGTPRPPAPPAPPGASASGANPRPPAPPRAPDANAGSGPPAPPTPGQAAAGSSTDRHPPPAPLPPQTPGIGGTSRPPTPLIPKAPTSATGTAPAPPASTPAIAGASRTSQAQAPPVPSSSGTRGVAATTTTPQAPGTQGTDCSNPMVKCAAPAAKPGAATAGTSGGGTASQVNPLASGISTGTSSGVKPSASLAATNQPAASIRSSTPGAASAGAAGDIGSTASSNAPDTKGPAGSASSAGTAAAVTAGAAGGAVLGTQLSGTPSAPAVPSLVAVQTDQGPQCTGSGGTSPCPLGVHAFSTQQPTPSAPVPANLPAQPVSSAQYVTTCVDTANEEACSRGLAPTTSTPSASTPQNPLQPNSPTEASIPGKYPAQSTSPLTMQTSAACTPVNSASVSQTGRRLSAYAGPAVICQPPVSATTVATPCSAYYGCSGSVDAATAGCPATCQPGDDIELPQCCAKITTLPAPLPVTGAAPVQVKCPRVCQTGDYLEMPQCCPPPTPAPPSCIPTGTQQCPPGSSAPGCCRTPIPHQQPTIVNPPGPVISTGPQTCWSCLQPWPPYNGGSVTAANGGGPSSGTYSTESSSVGAPPPAGPHTDTAANGGAPLPAIRTSHQTPLTPSPSTSQVSRVPQMQLTQVPGDTVVPMPPSPQAAAPALSPPSPPSPPLALQSFMATQSCTSDGCSSAPSSVPQCPSSDDLGNDPSNDPSTMDPSNNPSTADPSTSTGTADPSNDPSTMDPSNNPSTTDPSTMDPSSNPSTTNPSTNPGTTDPSTTGPSNNLSSMDPSNNNPSTTDPSAPSTTNPSNNPSTTAPSTASTNNPSNTPGTTDPSNPSTTNPSNNPSAADPSSSASTADPSSTPGTPNASGPPAGTPGASGPATGTPNAAAGPAGAQTANPPPSTIAPSASGAAATPPAGAAAPTDAASPAAGPAGAVGAAGPAAAVGAASGSSPGPSSPSDPGQGLEASTYGSDLVLGPGKDTPLPPASGGGRGFVGGTYGAASTVPRMLDPAQSGQQAKPILYVLSDCQYMIRAGATCGPTGPGCGLPWAKRAGCGPNQLAGGCCQPGFTCSADASKELRCLPILQPAYEFSDPTCNKIAYQGVCGKQGDCCPDGWTCQRQHDNTAICLAARASVIPAALDSLILDYQSPRALPGYYPGESGQKDAARRRHLLQAPETPLQLPLTGIGALNLPQYTGLWGGKWCQSAFDPPAPANATAKQQCPQLNMAVAPAIKPVLLPAIDSLSNGTLGAMRNGTKQPLVIKAFNWGGFDDGSTYLGGLYVNRSISVGDMAMVVYRAQLLGFNAVRLPFRFSDLNLPPKNWEFPCDLQSYNDTKEQVSNPVGDYGRANLTTYRLPKPYAFPVYNAAQSKQCNVYIPPYSTLARFQWVLQYLAGAGFYVIPAYQPADNSVDNTVVSTPAIFLRNWANLWASISDLPGFNTTLKGRIMLDLISEPDIFGLQWEANVRRYGFLYPAYPDLLGPTAQAILRIDSSAIFMIEGTGQANRFPGMAWGNGFVTNASLIRQYNLSDPTTFFDNLLEVPELLRRTVIAPHVYGPNVTAWQSGTNGTGLWTALEQGFNYLASAGYSSAAGKGSAQLPILIGELGSTLQGPQEGQFFLDFEYFAHNMNGSQAGPPHNLTSWAWYSMGNGWSYPSHLPQLPDGSVDWGVVNVVSSLPNRFIEQPRLPGLGLTPWYLHARRMLPSGSLRAHASYHSRNHTGNYTAYQNAMAPAEHRPHPYVNSSAYVPINVTAHYANHTVPRQNAMRLHNAFPANASAPHSRNSSLLGGGSSRGASLQNQSIAPAAGPPGGRHLLFSVPGVSFPISVPTSIPSVPSIISGGQQELGQIAGAATSTGQQVVTGISSGAGNAVSGVESLASTAEATYTTIEGQTITAEQELDNIYAGVASIPDTLNYLEGYFDDYDYDLEQLFEDAAAGDITGAIKDLTSDDLMIYGNILGGIAKFIPGYTQWSDRCNGFICSVPTPPDTTCGAAALQQMRASFCGGESGIMCNVIGGETINWEDGATLVASLLTGTFAAWAESEIDGQIDQFENNGLTLAANLVQEAVSSMGQDVIGALSSATSPCASPIILRAGFLTFGGNQCIACVCGPAMNAGTPWIGWKIPQNTGCPAQTCIPSVQTGVNEQLQTDDSGTIDTSGDPAPDDPPVSQDDDTGESA